MNARLVSLKSPECVIGVTGHQDLPVAAFEYARREIEKIIAQRDAVSTMGVSSLAVGADQLFARLVVAAGAALSVIIPSDQYERTFDEKNLRAYKKLLAAASITETLAFDEPSEEAFYAAGRRVVEVSDYVLAIWDGQPAKGRGGTADIVSYAESRGRKVHVIWPSGVARGSRLDAES